MLSVQTFLDHCDSYWKVAFNPEDSSQLISASNDGSARIWDLSEKKRAITTFEMDDRVWSVDFSPDGKRLTAVTQNGHLSLVDTDNMSIIDTRKLDVDTLIGVRENPNRDELFLTDKQFVRVANPLDLSEELKLFPCQRNFTDAETDSTGSRIVAGSDGPFAYLFDRGPTSTKITEIRHPAPVRDVAFHPDDSVFVTACDDGKMRLWNADDATLVRTPVSLRGSIETICFSPDGELFAVAATNELTVRLYRTSDWRPHGYVMRPSSLVQDLAISPGGGVLATALSDGTVRLWDVETGLPLGMPIRHQTFATCVRFSNDGRWMASGSFDHTVKVWRLPDWIRNQDNEATKLRIWTTTASRRKSRDSEAAIPWEEWQTIQKKVESK